MLGLITGPLQARALGPIGRGDLAAIFAVSSFLPVLAGLGLETVATREAARGTPVGEILGTIGPPTILVALLLVPLGFPISDWLAHARPTVHVFILLQFLLLPAILPLQLLNCVLLGLERWTRIMIARTIPILLPAVVVVVLYVTSSMTVEAVAIIVTVSAFISSLPALRYLPRPKTLRLRTPLLRSGLSFGLSSWLGTLALLTNGRLDQLIMIGFTSERQLGLYAVAVTSTTITSQIIGSIGLPLLSRVSSGDRELVPRAVRTTIMVVIALDIVTAAATPFVIPLLFGSAFRSAVPMSWILLVASVPFSATLVLTPAMIADGHPGVPARGEALTLFITIPGLLLLLPSLGGIGAAWVSLAAYSVDAIYQVRVGRAIFGGTLADYILPTRADVRWAVSRLLRLLPGRTVSV
jgi:O-antigen/teichoic acid export membrane protein